jgi:hypothetical protein
MRTLRTTLMAGGAILLLLVFSGLSPAEPPASNDPLAAEIALWTAYVSGNTSTDEDWVRLKEAAGPMLGGAEEALKSGRRLLALQRLGSARVYLSAARYVGGFPNEKLADSAAFEAEWARAGGVLKADLSQISPRALDGVLPAAVRAMGEAALPQIKGYYDASLEYGRNTMAKYGLLYIGIAQAQKDFVAFCRSLSVPSSRPAPPLRPLSAELDRLESDLLAAYRPPASIDRHSEFIAASATLNEARQLDEAGLRYGAIHRYLQASLRAAPLLPAGKPLAADAVRARLKDLEARLASAAYDNSIGQLWIETARAEQEAAAAKPPDASKPAAPDTAATIADDILPRYLAALAPGKPSAPRPAPEVTVTLVRWPYT